MSARHFKLQLTGIGIETLSAMIVLVVGSCSRIEATPANKAALVRYYDKFLTKNLNQCTTCHLPSDNKSPETLDEFPHNPFGDRLRALGKELSRAGEKNDVAARLAIVAKEDSDHDSIPNDVELLLGHGPGDLNDKPDEKELTNAPQRGAEFQEFLASYRWDPFETVKRPALPTAPSVSIHGKKTELDRSWGRNPIDSFIAAEHQARNLKPQAQASREVLLRRIYLDLIGLPPTPAELIAFENDRSFGAYEKVVDSLLADPRYGERWGRHWMDIWRYSDWAGWSGGNQIRDSKPHIWRWRDWIVESLNQDKGYDQMILEMLAADELAPEDANALRAVGFLVRNFKLLSREQWLEDTIKHTSQAFLGVTIGCAKCHNHMYDPISQKEYYEMRAIFEPHQVRTDRVQGQVDTTKDGLVRVFDTDTNAPTYLFVGGDERRPDTNRVMMPAVPQALCGLISSGRSHGKLNIEPVRLPRSAALPDKREFVIKDIIVASKKAVADARTALRENKAKRPEAESPTPAPTEDSPKPGEKKAAESSDTSFQAKLTEAELNVSIAEVRHESLLAILRAEELEDSNKKEAEEWKQFATEAAIAQRKLAVMEAKLKLHLAKVAEADAQSKAVRAAKEIAEQEKGSEGEVRAKKEPAEKRAARKQAAEKAAKHLEEATKKTTEAAKGLVQAEKELDEPPAAAYKPRPTESYPTVSTGRRLAFARWLVDKSNPLTARVAMNHIWLRHFGQGIVPTPADFGRNGRAPSHPQLLDWLAAELMAQNWNMKAMHRMIVTSSTYRMASAPDEPNAKLDPDNIYLWRMPSRRMEAEVIRDSLLYVSGNLDQTIGGPDIDHLLGLTSQRRSIYLRIAAEKEVEFLKIFDSPSVTECYERRPSVMPQQALALSNSELTRAQSRSLARSLANGTRQTLEDFVARAFVRILARHPSEEETRLCCQFLEDQTQRLDTAPPAIAADDPTKTGLAWPALRARENLVLVLFSHNDFVSIR